MLIQFLLWTGGWGLQDKSIAHINKEYEEFQKKVQNRHLGETAQFWISLMVDAKLVFLLTQTVKMNNMKLFHECNGEMATLLFTFDRKIIFIFSNTFMFKQHSSGKTIDRHYDKRKRFFFFSSFFSLMRHARILLWNWQS